MILDFFQSAGHENGHSDIQYICKLSIGAINLVIAYPYISNNYELTKIPSKRRWSYSR